MDLKSVTTPAELVNQNQEPVAPDADRLDALVESLDLDLNETYELTKRLVQRLGSFHQSVVAQLTEEGETERAVVWAQDEKLLETAWKLLNEVADNE